jgi:DNA-binding CsgD family transcriptional regulator
MDQQPRFVGRGTERERFEALFQQARAGTPSMVVIEGEAGIGKTRLIFEMTTAAEAVGALVLQGACPPVGGRDMPLAPLVSAIRRMAQSAEPTDMAALAPARPALAPLIPALAVDPPMAATGAPSGSIGLGVIFEHVLGLLERLADAHEAVILVLEDLHWAAPSTWDLVAYLARNLARCQVVVVCSYREDALLADPRDALAIAELARLPTVASMSLGGLARDDAEALVGTLAPALSATTRTSIVDRADGNPYVITELLSSPASLLPESIRASVEARLAAVPDPILRVLRVAALLGRRFDPEILLAVLGESIDEVIARLRAAVNAGFLDVASGRQEGPDMFAFRQEVVRELVLEGIVPGERSRLHGRIARVLTSSARDDDQTPERVIEIATHWRASDDPVRAVPALLRAARSAEGSYGFVEADRLYTQAFAIAREAASRPVSRGLGFQPPNESAGEQWDAGPEWAELRASAAEAASLAGDAGRAIELVDAALGHPGRPNQDVSTWARRRARYLLEAGQIDESLTAYEQLEAAAIDQPAPERARLLLARAQALASLGRHLDAAEYASSALQLVRGTERSLEWQALQIVGASRALSGDREAGLAALNEAWALGARGAAESAIRPRPSRIGEILEAQLGAARALAQGGESDAADSLARSSAAAANRLGAVRLRGELDLLTAWQQFDRGDWDGATRASESVLDAPGPATVKGEALTLRGLVSAERGLGTDAERDLADAAAALAFGDPQVRAKLHLATAKHAAWRRRHHDAIASVEEGLAELANRPAGMLAAELALAALRSTIELRADSESRRARGEALVHGDAAVRWLGQLNVFLSAGGGGGQDAAGDIATTAPGSSALLAIGQAEFSRLQGGRSPDGTRAWEVAVAAAHAAGNPYSVAWARWRLAEALLAQRDARAATTEVRQAHETAERLGAAPLLAELEALAARARLDIRASQTAAAPPTTSRAEMLGLSDRELEVLILVARGRTNRQIADELFITEKTAGHHVSNILAKLDVANRLEAATVAHRAGLLDASRT